MTYNAANQTSFGGRTYNGLLQMTGAGGMTYGYSPTQNNGQITSSVNGATGETVTYQYDALKRLSGEVIHQEVPDSKVSIQMQTSERVKSW